MADGYDPRRNIIAGTPADRKNRRDMLTEAGASALAAELNHWWHSRGYPQVAHWVELGGRKNQAIEDAKARIYVVRSNLVAGLPPKAGSPL